MAIKLADRVTSMAESATLAMAAKAREFKAKGIDVISLSLGEPDFKTPKHIQEGAKEAIDSGKYFGYPPVNGYADLREAIANKLKTENNIESNPEQIVVSNGAKQSLANLFQAIINPGDEVIIYAPYWVSYEALVELAGGVPVYITGELENEYKASAQQLKDAITEKTKAVIFSSPCNPTGSVFTEEELNEMADVLKGHPDIIAIADEIYELINYTGKHVSLASIDGMVDRTVTVNGFAKGFAMTGWRVGYLSAPIQIAKACNKIQGQLTSANCSIAQRAALTALTTDLGPSKEMAAEYLRRRDFVYELLNDLPGFKTNIPKGAFYFFPDVSYYFGKSDGNKTINNSSDLAMYILEEAHVSTVAGEAFGLPTSIRLSYAASEEELREAVKRMKVALAKLH
ncbi:pyridoxal phosphate-dependent aminotransferase [Marinigracilibium pacificum]|uniref:Aminotransferase n=1 Tax=Marinigracilibium pacificum TaxID=2729599 RepID=A0A848J303_9BACT|nr:pyridoxal phosphate-dependent aminotransferase [Marinigracilibium pacificum]NMM48719.1 pyridoxal phosphate-dependent aminotransferase [Marinigracilibium pacificum]